MTEWITGILMTCIPTIITTIVGISVKRWTNKLLEHKDEEKKTLNEIKNDIGELKSSNQANLRHDLYELYDYWKPKKYCPRNVKADFDNLYIHYHKLGSNGVMDKYYREIMALPDRKEY